MIKEYAVRQAIKEFKAQSPEKILYIVYECKFLKDLSLDLEFSKNYVWPFPGNNVPIIPEDRKGIHLFRYPGYMRELGFYGFVIYSQYYRLYYHVNEKKGFLTKC